MCVCVCVCVDVCVCLCVCVRVRVSDPPLEKKNAEMDSLPLCPLLSVPLPLRRSPPLCVLSLPPCVLQASLASDAQSHCRRESAREKNAPARQNSLVSPNRSLCVALLVSRVCGHTLLLCMSVCVCVCVSLRPSPSPSLALSLSQSLLLVAVVNALLALVRSVNIPQRPASDPPPPFRPIPPRRRRIDAKEKAAEIRGEKKSKSNSVQVCALAPRRSLLLCMSQPLTLAAPLRRRNRFAPPQPRKRTIRDFTISRRLGEGSYSMVCTLLAVPSHFAARADVVCLTASCPTCVGLPRDREGHGRRVCQCVAIPRARLPCVYRCFSPLQPAQVLRVLPLLSALCPLWSCADHTPPARCNAVSPCPLSRLPAVKILDKAFMHKENKTEYVLTEKEVGLAAAQPPLALLFFHRVLPTFPAPAPLCHRSSVQSALRMPCASSTPFTTSKSFVRPGPLQPRLGRHCTRSSNCTGIAHMFSTAPPLAMRLLLSRPPAPRLCH